MRHIAFLLYGLLSYFIFFGTFLYSAAFLSNRFIPKTIDSGEPGAIGTAFLVNVVVLALFALQHSGMARPGFKAWWTRIVPEPIERSTYVFLSSLAMWVMFAFWQPMPTVLWAASSPAIEALMNALFLGGLGLVFVSTLLIDHFDLFGLRQVFLHFRGVIYEPKPFTTPSLYRYVRHPLYWGWFFTIWATPNMTVGHLLFASICTAYIMIAVRIEERDLVDVFGERYRRYQDQVPMFVPRPRREMAAGPATATN